jgi:hypothetical protein
MSDKNLQFSNTRAILFTIISCISSPVFASEAPDAATWVKEYLSAEKPTEGVFVERIVAVKALPEKGIPEFPELKRSVLAEATYFQTVDLKNFMWDLRINSKDDSELRDFGFIQKISAADTLLIENGEGKWGVRFKGKNESQNFDTEFKMNPKGEAKDAATALFPLFGYDGIILDTQGTYVLIGSTAKILRQPNVQAMALADSSEKVSLKNVAREGAGLLNLVSVSGGFAVFEITLLGRGLKKLPVGTKVIIERKSKT